MRVSIVANLRTGELVLAADGGSNLEILGLLEVASEIVRRRTCPREELPGRRPEDVPPAGPIRGPIRASIAGRRVDAPS